MIEEVVPPLTQRRLASPSVVEKSIVDHEPVQDIFASARDSLVTRNASALTVRLPESMMEELRWVAGQEGCEVTDIVINAVDEFLADHWVRNSDDF